jgi:hypothetical protein
MEKYRTSYYRCGCCDISFDSQDECREHFESTDHEIVAFPAFVRFIAAFHREIERGKSFDDVVEFALSR